MTTPISPTPVQFGRERCHRCMKVLPETASFCPRCGGQARPIATPAEALDDADYLDDDAPPGAPPRQAQYATTNALKYVLKTGRTERARENPSMVIAPPPPPPPLHRPVPVLHYSSTS